MAALTFSRSSSLLEYVPILSDKTGSGKSNMAASKPEIVICQLIDKLKTKFRRLDQYYHLKHK